MSLTLVLVYRVVTHSRVQPGSVCETCDARRAGKSVFHSKAVLVPSKRYTYTLGLWRNETETSPHVDNNNILGLAMAEYRPTAP